MEPLIIEEGSYYIKDNPLHVEKIKELILRASKLRFEPAVWYFESVLDSDYWTITTDFVEFYEELVAYSIEELIKQDSEIVQLLEGVSRERVMELCRKFTYEYTNELIKPMSIEDFVKEVIDARHLISVYRYYWG